MHLTRKKSVNIINRNTDYSDTPKKQLKHSTKKAARREAKAEARQG